MSSIRCFTLSFDGVFIENSETASLLEDSWPIWTESAILPFNAALFWRIYVAIAIVLIEVESKF
jgi:hypothetical protein